MFRFARSIGRPAGALAVAAVLLGVTGPAASARALTVVIDDVHMGRAAATRDGSVGIAPPPCNDSAYKLLGGKQKSTYQWSFKTASTPSGLNRSAVLGVLQKSFSNITNENNDCGRPDTISATDQYLGKTTRSPNCMAPDGHNVVGFGRLPAGVLAVTCYWINNGKIIEADMKINSAESWALSLAKCHGTQPLLESTITHEAGHVFGLDHVGEKRHGRLTMSPYIDGPCEDNEVTLGLGDMLGLEHLY